MINSDHIWWQSDQLQLSGQTVTLRQDHTDTGTSEVALAMSLRGARVKVDGVWQTYPAERLGERVETDEMESSWQAGPLKISWRHSVELVWTMRVALHNTGHVLLDAEVILELTAGAGRECWGVRQGAESSWALLSAGETLWSDLVSGQTWGSGTELVVAARQLLPGQQAVASWRTDRVADLPTRHAMRHAILPQWDWHDRAETVTLSHPDHAVTSTVINDVYVHQDTEGQLDINGDPGGRAQLALAGARGEVTVDVGFAAAVDETVARVVGVLAEHWPLGRQGMLIKDPLEALLAQHALAADVDLARREAIGAAVEGAVARLGDQPSVWTAALLAGQAVLSGDADQAAAAVAMSVEIADQPGSALTWMPVIAAAALTGVDLEPLVRSQPSALQDGLLGADPHRRVASIARRLGLGLRGSRIGTPTPVADALEVALLSHWLAARPDAALGELAESMVVDLPELLVRHRRRLCHLAVRGEVPVDVMGWLVLAHPG